VNRASLKALKTKCQSEAPGSDGVLYDIAFASIRVKKNGEAINPVLHEYYQKKKESKPKKVALGAVIRKVSNIIFAILRDSKPYGLKTPEQHRGQYLGTEKVA